MKIFNKFFAKKSNNLKKNNKEIEEYDVLKTADSIEPQKDKKENLFTSVIYAFLIAMFIRTFLYEPFHIPSGSMKPGLLDGDFILVSKFSYGYGRYTIPFGIPLINERIFDVRKPKRGDVIVFRLPANPKINYIKRLIGLPGDVVEVKNGILTINGEEITRKYIGEYFDEKNEINFLEYEENITESKKIKILQKYKNNSEEDSENLENNGDGTFEIPENFYFFMGDNRDNSLDSRFVETGLIPYRNIVGKAKIIFFSKNGKFFKLSNWGSIIRFKRIFKIIK